LPDILRSEYERVFNILQKQNKEIIAMIHV
jgi:hypothetical protein